VVEIGPLFPMRFDDLGAAPDEIRAWLQRTEPLYAAKIPGTPALLDHYAKAIEKFLETKGLKKQVAGTLNGDNPSEVFAVFRPAGRLPVIAEVRFIGNAVVPAFALQNAVASSAVGLPYNEARFRLTLDSTIRPLYEKRGRIRVSFPDIQVEPAKNVTGLTITVSIKEGESYQLGKVKVEGTGISPEALLKTGAFKTGDPADFDQVQEGLDRIRTKLGSTGYLHPVINVEREVNDQSKSVDLTIHIEPGAQYLFGKLRVEGLDLNGEAEIARLWALKEGTPFKADYPDYFLERVKEGAVFENLKQTKAIQKADDKAHTVDVTLVFK